MIEASIILGLVATVIYIATTFTRLKLATVFRDFVAVISSIIAGIASTMLPTGEEVALLVFLYIISLWFYGVERQEQSSRRFVDPASSRVFVGIATFIIATWICFSRIDLRLTLIIALSSLIFGAYKLRMIMRETTK